LLIRLFSRSEFRAGDVGHNDATGYLMRKGK
jgi:hypothetical protein